MPWWRPAPPGTRWRTCEPMCPGIPAGRTAGCCWPRGWTAPGGPAKPWQHWLGQHEALSGGGAALARTEARILSATKQSPPEPAGAADSVWNGAAASWDRSVPARSQARLHATVGLLRDLAVTGPDGLEEAHRHRRDLVEAAETPGDPQLAARVIGSYDVPAAAWTRADNPGGSGELRRAAARTAARPGPDGSPALRTRLLSVVAVESGGDAAADTPLPRASGAPATEPWRLRAERAADEAVRLARRLSDPALLAFALKGAFMQAFAACGSADRRDALGTELTRPAVDHQLPGHEVLGRIIRLQAFAGLGDFTQADTEAEEVDRLADRNERPPADVFTAWYRALRLCETDGWPTARHRYARLLRPPTAACPTSPGEPPPWWRWFPSCGATPRPAPATSTAWTRARISSGSTRCCWQPPVTPREPGRPSVPSPGRRTTCSRKPCGASAPAPQRPWDTCRYCAAPGTNSPAPQPSTRARARAAAWSPSGPVTRHLAAADAAIEAHTSATGR